MIDRYRHYFRNLGTGRALANTLFFAVFIFFIARTAAFSGNVVVSAALLAIFGFPILLGLLLPLLFLGSLVANPQRASQLMRLLQFAVFGVVLVIIVYRPQLPLWALLGMLGLASLLHGVVFWFFSDKRVLTPRAMQALLKNYPTHDDNGDADDVDDTVGAWTDPSSHHGPELGSLQRDR